MGTVVGAVVGILGTIVVAHYYFRRTVSKSIGVYGLLNSFVFAGIMPDVRKQLQFLFQKREVDELQQLMFLVANDGERPIRDVIEALSLTIPPQVEILDASVVHRHPETLRVDLITTAHEPTGSDISLDFPLLNKGEFFIVKLLLSGRFEAKKATFRILADDLPRTIQMKQLPSTAFQKKGYKFEWGLALASLIVLLFPAWAFYTAYLLQRSRPELFPYPWLAFTVSTQSMLLLIPGAIIVLFLSLIGALLLGAAVSGGEFPPQRGPRFPLPKELKEMAFPYRMEHFTPEFDLPDQKGKRTGSRRRRDDDLRDQH